MFSLSDRVTLETEREMTDTQFGFTWVHVDGKYRLRSPDDKFKEFPGIVVETLKEEAAETSIEELIERTAEKNPGAANVIRGMHEEGFIREGDPVERIHPPEDVRLWPRAAAVGLLLVVVGAVWVHTLLSLAGPIIDDPMSYLVRTAYVSIPLLVGTVVAHEYGHHRAARNQGLDPEFGVTVINGVVPAIVTRTHAGWCLPRNRRMWNTLAGPAYGFVWTLGIFALYHTAFPHPGIAVAAILSYNLQVGPLLPVFHGDGYLLLTDYFDEHNLRSRGLEDLRERRLTWPAAYAAFTYGFVGVGFTINLLIGYLLAGDLGALVILCLILLIYAESRLEVVERLRTAIPPSGR